MNTAAPAIGGASGSTTPALHSAWNPYTVLPPTTRRKVDPSSQIPTHPFLQTLGIPASVAADRLSAKYLQLETPEGKVSDRRKAQLKKREDDKDRKKTNRVNEGACGLVGRRKRKKLGKAFEGNVRYDAVLPVYELWLGYMAELLALPVQLPAPLSTTTTATSDAPAPSPITKAIDVLLPTFPPRPTNDDPTLGLDLKLNVPVMQAKLVKAEFVGCKLTVLSKKGSIFSFSLPLSVPATANHTATTQREVSFDIFGDAFAYRSSDRVGKKWKAGSGPGGVELL
ncbi:hypothetical protein RQP46_007563 [Phenoliferia psychrophenolica]